LILHCISHWKYVDLPDVDILEQLNEKFLLSLFAIFLFVLHFADKIWDMVRRRKHRKENSFISWHLDAHSGWETPLQEHHITHSINKN
jgi:DNA-directed RNA polymerase specialized sigma54-like protein